MTSGPHDTPLNLPDLVERCAKVPLPIALAEAEAQAGWAEGSLDVWLWDYQNRSLASLRTDATAQPGDLVEPVPVRVLGCEIGVVTLTAREPTGADRDRMLRVLAATLGLALRAQDLAIDRIAMTRRQGRQLSLAAELQWSLLAPAPLRVGHWQASAALEPAYDCGGDLYDLALTGGDRLHVAVLDAVGHGLRSAQISAVALAALRQGRREGDPLAALAERIDVAVTASLQTGFVTGLLVEVDLGTGSARWLSAGHPPPLHQAAEPGRLDELDLVASLPFGLALEPGPVVRPVHTVPLAPGDSLVLYSDGVLENIALDSMMSLGRDRFGQLLDGVLSDRRPDPARAVSDLLLAATGPTLRDDATVAVIRHAA